MFKVTLRHSKAGLRLAALASALPLLALTAQAQSTITNGLVAYWNFDGSNFKDSVGKFDGTGNGTAAIAFVSGKPGFGQAIQLDGVDEFIEITGRDSTYDPDQLAFPGGSITVAGWFTVGTFDKSWQALIAKGEGTNWRVHRNGTNPAMAYAGGIGEGPNDGPDVTDGNWHHFAAQTDANAVNFGTCIWIDGVQTSINSGTPVLNTNAKNMKIGDNPDATGRYWNGKVDDLAIWNRLLTPTEIAALYNNGVGKPVSTFFGPPVPQPLQLVTLSPGPGAPSAPFDTAVSVGFLNGTNTLNTNSVAIKLDNASITPTVAVQAGGVISYSYQPASFFLPHSVHSIALNYSDSNGVAYSSNWNFTVTSYAYLTKDLAVTPDKTKPGFLFDYFQDEDFQVNGFGAQNSIWYVDQLLAGNFNLTNNADSTVLGSATSVSKLGTAPNSMVEFVVPTVINMDKAAGSNGHFQPQDQMPGTPGISGASNGQLAIAKTYLDLPAGITTMGVTSDDDFRVLATMPGDALGKVTAGEFDANGRGAADTLFRVVVKDAGVYPFILEWENGGGGSNVSWFTKNGTNYSLVGDTANGGVAAYRAITSSTAPTIVSVTPEPSDAYPGTTIRTAKASPYGPLDSAVNLVKLVLQDGSGSKVDTNSFQLSVDGGAMTPTSVTSANGQTTVSYTPATRLADNSDHTASFAFKDSTGAARTNSWNFHTGYITSDTLFIEVEDWDYSHGKTIATGIGMDGPYPGGSFVGLGATTDDPFDYHVDQTSPSGTPPWYRPNVNVSPGKVNGSALNGRGYFHVSQWWTVGWNDAGSWNNYTRTFPAKAQNYEAYAHFASGGSPIAVELDQITAGTGQTDASQTKKMLGVFAPGRPTAGWDTMEIFKLTADTNGTPATVSLSGTTTLRLTMLPGSNEDMDYIAFRPVAGGGGGGASFSNVSVSSDHKSAVLTYTGTLQSSAVVAGPWTDVPTASSPYTATIAAKGNLFYRVH